MAALTDRVNVGVGVIVRDESNNVLLGKRISDKHGKGEFSFPGGKPDPGEHPAYAALRELYEETGIVGYGMRHVDVWTYDRYESDGVHCVTLYFEVYTEQEPVNREPDKCDGWNWFAEDALPSPLFSGVEEALANAPGF